MTNTKHKPPLSSLPRASAQILEACAVDPDGADLVGVGVHVDRQGELDLWGRRHEDVRLAHALDDGRAVRVGRVEGQPHHPVARTNSLQCLRGEIKGWRFNGDSSSSISINS